MRFAAATAVAFAVLIAPTVMPTIAQADPVPIRVGWVAPVANFASILLMKPELMHNQGKSYDLQPQHFASTPTMIPALAAGAIDIGSISYAAFANAIENAGMEDLRVIADDFQDGVNGSYSDEIMVLKDSPIRTVDDLKGKVASSNGAGGAVDVALRVMLKKHGLEDKRDLSIVEVSLANQKAALAAHKSDVVTTAIPFSKDPELRKIARTLFTQADAIGPSQMILWAARTGFIEKNRAALVDLLADTIRARRFYTDPANHKEAVKIAADFSKQPAESLDSWLFTKDGDYYHDPDDRPNMKAFQANIDTQHEQGFLKATLDVSKYADLSLVNDAVRKVQKQVAMSTQTLLKHMDEIVDAFCKRNRFQTEKLTPGRARSFVRQHRQNTRRRNSVLKLKVATNIPDWDMKLKVIKACSQEIIADNEFGHGKAHWQILTEMGLAIGMTREDIENATPIPTTEIAWAAWEGLMANKHWLEGVVANACAERGNVPGYGTGIARELGMAGAQRPQWKKLFNLTDDQVEFWEMHSAADLEHSEIAWKAVAAHAERLNMEDDVIHALDVNLRVWEMYFNGICDAGDQAGA